jgi:hypothetical protein
MLSHMHTRFSRVLIASLTLATCVFLQGCEDQLTLANFDQIKTGQAEYEVENLLGGKGERDDTTGVSISAGGIAGSSTNSQLTYIWKAKGKEVSVTFQGGKVVTKSQRGLE